VSSTTTEPAGEPAVEQAAPAAEKAKPAPKVAEGVTVKALVDALRAAGVKPKVRWNPKRTYASLLVGEKNIGYASKPTRKGMKVEPVVSLDDLTNGVKKAHEEQVGKGAFGARIMVVDAKGLAHAVAGLVAADEKRKAKGKDAA
jgi:hypothetical protein